MVLSEAIFIFLIFHYGTDVMIMILYHLENSLYTICVLYFIKDLSILGETSQVKIKVLYFQLPWYHNLNLLEDIIKYRLLISHVFSYSMFKNLLLMSTLAFAIASSAPTNEVAIGKHISNAILSLKQFTVKYFFHN